MPFRSVILIVALLLSAMPCTASSVQSLLSAVDRECTECGIKGRPEMRAVDSLMHVPASRVTRKALLEATFKTLAALNSIQSYGVAMRFGSAVVPMLSEDMGESNDELQPYIYVLDEYGSACSAMGMQSQLCDTYIKALTIARAHHMTAEEAILLNNMGTVYSGMSDWTKAADCLNKAIKINEAAHNTQRLFVNYNNLSGVMVAQGKFDKGLELAYLALHQLDGTNQPDMEMLMQRNICSIYRKKKQTRMALDMIHKIITYQLAHRQQVYLADSYRLAGALYADAGNPDSALICYTQALGVATQVDQRIALLGAIADACAVKGNYLRAYQSMRDRAALRDSVAKLEQASRTRVMSGLYDNEQRYLGMIDSLYKWRSGQWWTMGLLVVALVGITLLWRRTEHRAATRHLEAERQNTALAKAQLVQTEQRQAEEIRSLVQRITTLEDEARRAAAESLGQSIEATRNAEYVAALNEQLKATLLKLSPKSTEARAKIRELIALTASYGDSSLSDFREVFGKVYPSFFDHIVERYGDLTPKEMRLCALLRLGLSTKSIADVTFREVRSVESARNRLRKKFGLRQQDNLITFLHQF